jgi:hypothetical protein
MGGKKHFALTIDHAPQNLPLLKYMEYPP